MSRCGAVAGCAAKKWGILVNGSGLSLRKLRRVITGQNIRIFELSNVVFLRIFVRLKWY